MNDTAQVFNSAGTGLMSCIEGLGGNRKNVLTRSGIDPDYFADPMRTIPVAQFSRLLQEASIATGHPDLGLRFARNYDIRWLGPLGYLLYHADTLGAALVDYERYFHTVQSHTDIDFRVSGDEAIVSYKVNDAVAYDRHHDAEFSTAIIIHVAEAICALKWELKRVAFEHSPTPNCDYRSAFGGMRPEFRANTNQFAFPAEFLNVRNANADPQLTGIVREFLSSRNTVFGEKTKSFAKTLSETVVHLLRHGLDARIETVAEKLGCTVRSVQRECNRGGTTFSAARSKAVIDYACELLRDPDMSFTEISFLLGFSESSAFSRAFRANIGVSPRDYRKSTLDLC